MKNQISLTEKRVSNKKPSSNVDGASSERVKDNDKSSVPNLRISQDWTITDIFERFPEKVDDLSEVMTEYGLHCVGCHVNAYETLEEGCLGHGFDEATTNSLINDLNKVISSEKKFGVVFSDSARAKLSEILKRKSKEVGKEVFLRINYDDSEDACCQKLFSLSFEKAPKDSDEVININDSSRAVFSRRHSDFINGLEIDHIVGKETGFVIRAESTRDCCGGEHDE